MAYSAQLMPVESLHPAVSLVGHTDAVLHTVSVVAVQAAFVPFVHVMAAAHAAHGALPVPALKVEPETQSGLVRLVERPVLSKTSFLYWSPRTT